jgi:hypothetical protein
MKRSALKSSAFKRKPGASFSSFRSATKELERKPMKKRARKAATKAEREHMGVVAGLCCVVCRNLGYGDSPAEVHHVRYLAGGGQRSSNLDTIPLCPRHHRIGGYGVAIHAGQEEWERLYGTEAQLLEQTRRETGITQPQMETV